MSNKPDWMSGPKPGKVPEFKPAKQASSRDSHQQDEEPPGPSSLAVAIELGREVGGRFRKQLLPLPLIAATHAAAAIGVYLLTGWATLAPIAAVALLGTFLYALGRERVTPAGRRHAKTAIHAAAGWVSLALLTGLANWTIWALWLGGYAAAVPYWMRHTDPDPDTEAEQAAPAPEPNTEPEPEKPAWQAQRWGVNMAAKNGPFPKSRLLGVSTFEHGWRAGVNLGRGFELDQLISKTGLVTSIFDQPRGSVFVEDDPAGAIYEGRLTVITRNPIHEVHQWPGPQLDVETGTMPLMTTADGQTLHWRLWWPGKGAAHGLISGAQGSGKTSTINLILAEIAASDRLYPVLIDGNNGQSFPDWLDHAPVVATDLEEALAVMQWLDQVRQARARHFARQRRRAADPTPDMPGIVLIIDEAHVLLKGKEEINKQLRQLVTTQAQMSRKTAISVILVTQAPSITELGGDTGGVLRGQLKANNVVSHRTTEQSDNGMIANVKLPEPLHMLPETFPNGQDTKGLGYFLTQRAIRARSLYYPEPDPGVTDPYAAMMADKRLDEVSASVPMPTGAGPAHPASTLHVATSDGHDVTETVRDALASGCPRNVGAVTQHTGLPMGSVRSALRNLN